MAEGKPLIDPDLLAKLACPKVRKPLLLAPADRLAALNEAIAAGTVQTVDGRKVEGNLDGLLLVEGEAGYGYPIRDAIPILLVDEAIQLT